VWQLMPKGRHAEGDRVAVDAEAWAKLKSGKTYRISMVSTSSLAMARFGGEGVPLYDPRNEVPCARGTRSALTRTASGV